jgi:hypothetical protein
MLTDAVEGMYMDGVEDVEVKTRIIIMGVDGIIIVGVDGIIIIVGESKVAEDLKVCKAEEAQHK